MGRKDKIFGVKYQNILVGRHLINYKEMFVVAPILIWYVVIIVFIFTSVPAIELFYFTQLCSFIGCFFEYLPIFISYRFLVCF